MNNHIIYTYQKWTKFYHDENLKSFSHIFDKKEEMIQNTKNSIKEYEEQISDGTIFKVFAGLAFFVTLVTIPLGNFISWLDIATFKTVAICMSVLFLICFFILLWAFISERSSVLNKQNKYFAKVKTFFDEDLYNIESFHSLLPQLQDYCNQPYMHKDQFTKIKLNLLNQTITDKDIQFIYKFMESYSKDNIHKVQLENFVDTTEKKSEQRNLNKNIKFFTTS